tara:strand:- start:12 stop:476 length:465 start_codon:yes stop_codon:yes gene_type:complete
MPIGISHATSVFLQTIASNTVLDSLSTWNIFNADFTFNINNDMATFNNLSSNFESVLWDFGDGITSTDENPLHIYTNSGNYTVSLTAYTNSNCKQETIIYSLTINIPTNINNVEENKNILKITDILGRKTSFKKNTILFYLFENGEVEQKIVTE